MGTVTLCIIVNNAEEVLHQCLSHVKEICDEIIVVDTGSTDKTKEIAGQFTEKIYPFSLSNDHSFIKNFAFSQATMDYILWLDADDLLLTEDLEKFKTLKSNLDGSTDAVSMIYTIVGNNNTPSISHRRNHLVKRESNFKWVGHVDEYLDVKGKILSSEIVITHPTSDPAYSDRNLMIYESRLNSGDTFTSQDLYHFANTLKAHLKFRRAIMYYLEFLATQKGELEDRTLSYIQMAECYRNLEDLDKERETLALSMKYDAPRSNVACRFGDLYKSNSEFKKAIQWYNIALHAEGDIAYSTWYPHLQLCVCYWQIGELDKSVEQNNKAKQYRPDDPKIKSNEEFFKRYFNN